MIRVRKAAERGLSKTDWLDSRHSFSFGEYRDANHVQFGPLRVINDDRVIPGAGFPTHGHSDMEIVTYVLSGALAHKDSLGTGSTIRRGEIQRMSAGSGIRHSEFNASHSDGVHFLQIWIIPATRGAPPSYEQKRFDDALASDAFLPIVVPKGPSAPAHAIGVDEDVTVHVARLGDGARATLDLAKGRRAWVQMALGEARLNGTPLAAGDGAAVEDEAMLAFTASGDAEILVFDLPGAKGAA